MFNIQFSGGNSSQIAVASFFIGRGIKEKEVLEKLYCAPHELKQLKIFLQDVRGMSLEDFNVVLTGLDNFIEAYNK